ncbi:MAG TPA: hemolysin family protein [Cryptosporangiaceae bacterium]|nr:hemolysin family protein [Cryptosporangiaceae bacterium]
MVASEWGDPAIDVWLPLVAFFLLTAANGFFVAAEFSLVTVDRAMVERQAAAGDKKAQHLQAALRSLSFQLSGAQFGITVSALLTGYLAEPALARLMRPATSLLPGGETASRTVSTVLALTLATLVSMLVGELLPKNAALAKPEPIARWSAQPMRVFSAVFKPIITALNESANWVVRRLGIEPQEELASARSPEELGLLAAISARAGALSPETATLLQRTIRFGEKRAAEAMTPRVDVVGLDTNATVADLLRLARESGKTRFPVYQSTLDQVIGVASVIDALGVPVARREATRVTSVSREPVQVPESLDLNGVLGALQEAGVEFAVVVDEYGGTDGIVTTEDLVEELVGEIDDEYDPPRAATHIYDPRITAPSADPSRLVSGLLRADELYEQTGFRLPEGPYETLAGFLMAELGHIPVEGETVDCQGWTFTVTQIDRRRVEQVRVMPPRTLSDESRPVVITPLGAAPAALEGESPDGAGVVTPQTPPEAAPIVATPAVGVSPAVGATPGVGASAVAGSPAAELRPGSGGR